MKSSEQYLTMQNMMKVSKQYPDQIINKERLIVEFLEQIWPLVTLQYFVPHNNGY
jgi:hypothetical protein